MMDVRILVIAEHAMIAALLGALVELAGYRPAFAEAGEAPDGAVARLRAHLVLLDCDHALAHGDVVYRAAALAGSRVLLFGSTLNAEDTARYAARRGVRWLSLPIGYHAFAERVREALAAPVAAPVGAPMTVPVAIPVVAPLTPPSPAAPAAPRRSSGELLGEAAPP